MAVVEILMTTLAVPLGKLLLKNYLLEPAAEVGGGLIDIAQGKIKGYLDQKDAARQFERLGERIVLRLVPAFEQGERNSEVSVQAVADELAWTLDGRVSAEFFLSRDLDPARLALALREARPVRRELLSSAEVALYNRVLDEAVRYVVQVASQLPKFEEALATQSLQRLSRLSEDVERVLDATRRIEKSVSVLLEQKDEEAHRYEADYRQAVMRNLDELELFGADISEEARRHALSVAYISLNLQGAGGGEEEGTSLPTEKVLADMERKGGRLLIRGEAGSGKSTLFRWVAISAAHLPEMQRYRSSRELRWWRLSKYEDDRPLARVAFVGRSWRLRVPFLVRLRDCTGGRLPSPEEFPAHVAGEIGNPPPGWVKSILQSGRALVLLDGIDEVPNAKREQLRKQIRALIGAYPPENYFIISTRPAAVPDGWLADLDFREASIDPMSEPDRTRFVEKWHEAVGRQLEVMGRPDPKLPEVAADLIEKLPDNPQVARLATNPLLCAMICALHRERHRKLPESQSAVCDAVCQMLLHRRERESDLDLGDFPAAYRDLSYDEKRAIVQHIAHYMVLNEESRISRENARAKVGESLRLFPSRSEASADEVLPALVERSGVLREAGPDSIDFIHNTLKEFLAAERFVHAGDVGLLAKHFDDGAWQPVILFAVATSQPEFATRLVSRILDIPPNASADEVRARHLFALRCRAAALHLAPNLTKRIDQIEKTLFPPRTMADAEALASSGDSAVDYLRSSKKLGAREAAASVRALRLIGTPKATRALRGYLKDRRRSVVSELVRAVNPLEIQSLLELVVEGKPLPGEALPFLQDLTLLVSHPAIERLNLSGLRDIDLSPLAKLANLRVLDLSGSQIRDLAPIAELSNLTSLRLWAVDIDDFTPISRMVDLQSLHLSGTNVVDLAPIAGLTNLRELEISDTRASDLAPLGGLTELRELYLEDTPVNDLTPLAHLANLETLFVEGGQVRDLTPITGLTNLQALQLVGANITDLKVFASLRNLRTLDLTDSRVGDLTGVEELANLKSLNLTNTLVSDLKPLARLTGLQELNLEKTRIRDFGPLAVLTNLRSLNLASTEIVDLKPVRGLTNLTYLLLSRTDISDLTPIETLEHLEYLFLSNTLIQDLSPIAGHVNLEYLDVSYTQVADLTPISGLDNLGFIDIRRTPARESLSAKLPGVMIFR